MARSAPAPEPVYTPPNDPWPQAKPRDDQVFAKSCPPNNWCSTDAGIAPEPASNFGKVMVAGAMLFPSASTAVATALGADLALGRLAGGGILQQRLNWAIRGAGGPASIFILGMLPSKMGDGTLHTDTQLRAMTHAPTRVRFQFRRDAEGALQVYGIQPPHQATTRYARCKPRGTPTKLPWRPSSMASLFCGRHSVGHWDRCHR